jgi:hypothetical protein
MSDANPFEVLRLDPTTPTEGVVRQAGRLRQRAADEPTVAAIRQAVQALTGRPADRLLHELLAHPAPCHAWPALERFATAFRRPPLPVGEVSVSCPPPALAEVEVVLRPVVAAQLDSPPLHFDPVDEGDSRQEILRQTVEGIWQTLRFDMRA